MGEVISINVKSNNAVTRPERARLPDDIKLSIDNWRLGGCCHAIPGDYLEWHFNLAGHELDRIVEHYRLEVMNDPRILSDEVCRAFIVEVLTFKQRRISIQWDDTRQAFMKRVPFGEHVHYEPLLERDLA